MPAPLRLPAAILAGGRANRMHGANKAMLAVGNERILERQLRTLQQVAHPVIVISHRSDEFAALGVAAVPDAIQHAGPLGGIYTALVTLKAPRVLVVGCDLPFLPPRLLARLVAPSTADLVIPHGPHGLEPLCATWSATCLPAIERRIGTGHLKVGAIVEDLRVEEIGPETLRACDPDGLLFVNVNTPDDHDRAQRLSLVESEKLRDRIMDVSHDS